MRDTVEESIQSDILDAMGEEAIGEEPKENAPKEMDLATFLIHRAAKDAKVANYFCW